MTIDETDKKIIEILQNDGRIKNAKLAAIIGISPSSTWKRVRRLEDRGVITRYVALLDHKKYGLDVIAIVSISLATHGLASTVCFTEKLQELEEVIECHRTSGTDDYILKVALKDIDSYAHFATKKLANIPGIRHIKSQFVLSTIKNITGFPVRYKKKALRTIPPL